VIDNRERLRRLATLLIFAVLANMTAMAVIGGMGQSGMTAYAEEASFDPGPPKGVVGQDGIACVGKASQGGNSLTYTVYIGADGDEMRDRPDRERSWQTDYCHWALEQDMSGWFKYQWDTALDPSNIKVTIKRL
jgi:hypothetical protein